MTEKLCLARQLETGWGTGRLEGVINLVTDNKSESGVSAFCDVEGCIFKAPVSEGDPEDLASTLYFIDRLGSPKRAVLECKLGSNENGEGS